MPEVADANLPRANPREVVGQSIDAAQATQGCCIVARPPDVLATVPDDACWTLDFHKAAELISLDGELARRTFDQAGLTTLFSRSGCPISRVIACDLANACSLGLALKRF